MGNAFWFALMAPGFGEQERSERLAEVSSNKDWSEEEMTIPEGAGRRISVDKKGIQVNMMGLRMFPTMRRAQVIRATLSHEPLPLEGLHKQAKNDSFTRSDYLRRPVSLNFQTHSFPPDQRNPISMEAKELSRLMK